IVRKSASLSIGLPHSGHSGGVSGRVSSSMVLSTSTNGTSATMPANNSPARLATAPIRMQPAVPPCAATVSHVVVLDLRRCRHRRIGKTKIGGVEFVAAHGVQRIGRLVERDGVL